VLADEVDGVVRLAASLNQGQGNQEGRASHTGSTVNTDALLALISSRFLLQDFSLRLLLFVLVLLGVRDFGCIRRFEKLVNQFKPLLHGFLFGQLAIREDTFLQTNTISGGRVYLPLLGCQP